MKSAETRDWLSSTTQFGYRVGLEILAAIWPVASEPVPYPHADELEALRSDFLRIGRDLQGVIEREAAREQINPD